MPVPLPVVITAGALPLGFKGNLQQTLNAFADALSASVDATFLTGQIGGTMPTHDIGPWANGSNWWFWDPVSGQYQPSNQGTPIGSVVVWGGQGAPVNWLVCDGRAVSRTLFSRLFQAVGTTFGVGDGASTFNLPPNGVFYVGATGASPVNTRAGAATQMITARMLPALQAKIFSTHITYNASGQTPADVLGPPGSPGGYLGPILDMQQIILGSGQTPLPTMPPNCSVNFIIKYQ